jgi:hypothetical protein
MKTVLRLLAFSEKFGVLEIADVFKAVFYELAGFLNGFGNFADKFVFFEFQ